MSETVREPCPAYLKLKEFFEKDPLCREAVKPLSGQARIRIRFAGHEGDYLFTAKGGRPLLVPAVSATSATSDRAGGAGGGYDVTLIVTPRAVDELLATPDRTLSGYGVRILELVAEDDPELKVRGWADAGILTLWRHGYFGYLSLGGGKLWEFLKKQGYGSFGALYRKIAHMRQHKD